MNMKLIGRGLCLGVIALGMQVIGIDAMADHGGVRSLRGDAEISSNNPAVDIKKWQADQGKAARNYVQQPPVIPHSIEGFDINHKINACLTCHSWNMASKTGATKIGISHFKDRDGNELAKVAPRRYFCTQCHVPQANANALVNNTFKPIDILKDQ